MNEKRQITGGITVDNNVVTQCLMDTESGVSKGSKNKGTHVVFAEGLEHTLDWSGTTMKELIHLASATVIIKLQGIWRQAGHGCKSEHGQTTNVHEFINRPINRTMRPAEDVLLEKVEKGELSHEALQDLIAKLQAKAKS